MAATQDTKGIRAPAKRVAAHLASLVRLERELAGRELGRKGAAAGAGAGAAVAAMVIAPLAFAFGLAAATAALTLLVAVWLALLIMFGATLLLLLVLVLVSRGLVRRAAPLKPEQALEEARLTRRILRGTRAD